MGIVVSCVIQCNSLFLYFEANISLLRILPLSFKKKGFFYGPRFGWDCYKLASLSWSLFFLSSSSSSEVWVSSKFLSCIHFVEFQKKKHEPTGTSLCQVKMGKPACEQKCLKKENIWYLCLSLCLWLCICLSGSFTHGLLCSHFCLSLHTIENQALVVWTSYMNHP